jgi:hypothetical protein
MTLPQREIEQESKHGKIPIGSRWRDLLGANDLEVLNVCRGDRVQG